MLKRSTGALLGLTLLSAAASAQGTTPLPTGYALTTPDTTTISAVATSSTRASLVSHPLVLVSNTGNQPACLAYGDVTVVAMWPCGAQSPFYAGPGQTVMLGVLGAGYLAGITGAGSTTLDVKEGYLEPQSSTVLGTVTADQGNAGAAPWPVLLTPAESTPAAPDISTVTTGGTAVNAFSAGHCAKGCFVVNPINATIALCGNGVTTASGTSSNAATICAAPGQQLNFTARSTAISVVSSDSSHPFGGEGYQ